VTRVILLAALVLAAIALGACGEKEERPGGAGGAERVDLLLDYFPNADHAGIYAAQGGGAFARAGLDVRPRTPPDPTAALKLLAARRADLAISYEPDLLLARGAGLKVQAVAALVQKPLTSIISLGRRAARTPGDLRGRTVGTAGLPYQSAFLQTILRDADVPARSVKRVNVGFNLTPAMLSGRVDATLGSFWNYEGVDLRRRGKAPRIIRMERVGVPVYNELVIVAREDTVREQGPFLRRFLLALREGHVSLRRDARTGVDPLLRANPDLERGLQTASVRATLPVFFPSDRERPFGWMEPREWTAFGRWMAGNGLLKQPEVVDRAYTNEFLPGEGI